MEKQDNTVNKTVQKVLIPGGDASSAELAMLSNLDKPDLSYFQRHWKSLDVKQRARIISRLVEFSEDDASLDFTGIFVLTMADEDKTIRITTIEGLALEDKPAYVRPILNAVTQDESEEVRAAAAAALGKFALMAELDELPSALAEDVFNALIGALENPREPVAVKKRALESIAVFQQQPVDTYIEDYYYSEDPAVKVSAIYAMGRNCNTRWLPFLIDELQSSIPQFRYEAARACGEIEDAVAVPHLIHLTEDDDKEVREAAIHALGKIGGQEARRRLSEMTRHTEPATREAAVNALSGLSACEDPLSLNS